MMTRLVITALLALTAASVAALAARPVGPRDECVAQTAPASPEIAPARPMAVVRARHRRGVLP